MLSRSLTALVASFRPRISFSETLLRTQGHVTSKLRKIFFGQLKELRAREITLLPVLPAYKSLISSPAASIPGSVSSQTIGDLIRETRREDTRDLIKGIMVDYESELCFQQRQDYFEQQWGTILIESAIPRIREMRNVLCTILGKPQGSVVNNLPICNLSEFGAAVGSGFAFGGLPPRPSLLCEYLRPQMDVKDLLPHLPALRRSYYGDQQKDMVDDVAEPNLNASIHTITLHLAIKAILCTELAETQYKKLGPIPSQVLKRNLAFILRQDSFETISDDIMKRGDQALSRIAEDIRQEYDLKAGKEFRSAADAWIQHVLELHKKKEVDHFKALLKRSSLQDELGRLGYLSEKDMEARGYLSEKDIEARGYLSEKDMEARGYLRIRDLLNAGVLKQEHLERLTSERTK